MRVPTYEEITGPGFERSDRFELADRIVGERFLELCGQGVIHGAFRFGSASFGDVGPGSDRDIIVAYQDPVYETEPATLAKLHSVAKEVYMTTGVPLEMTCASLGQFQAGEHTLTRPMLRWLRRQPEMFPRDILGENFVGT